MLSKMAERWKWGIKLKLSSRIKPGELYNLKGMRERINGMVRMAPEK